MANGDTVTDFLNQLPTDLATLYAAIVDSNPATAQAAEDVGAPNVLENNILANMHSFAFVDPSAAGTGDGSELGSAVSGLVSMTNVLDLFGYVPYDVGNIENLFAADAADIKGFVDTIVSHLASTDFETLTVNINANLALAEGAGLQGLAAFSQNLLGNLEVGEEALLNGTGTSNVFSSSLITDFADILGLNPLSSNILDNLNATDAITVGAFTGTPPTGLTDLDAFADWFPVLPASITTSLDNFVDSLGLGAPLDHFADVLTGLGIP